MPRFSDFNEGFRNHRIILWIHLLDRGMGLAFEKDWSPFAKDPWWFRENQKLIDKQRKTKKMWEFSMKKKIQVLQRTRNFLGVITFPDLSPELRTKYKQLKQQHTYEGLDEEYTQGVRYTKLKKKYQTSLLNAAIFMRGEGLLQKEIAERLKLSEASVSRMLNKVSIAIP